MKSLAGCAAWGAAGLFVIALLLASVGVPEYSHRVHPVALRGTAGLPWAFAFNLVAFVVPGALLAVAGVPLRNALREGGWAARIGLVLVQFSALAFAAQACCRWIQAMPIRTQAACTCWHGCCGGSRSCQARCCWRRVRGAASASRWAASPSA